MLFTTENIKSLARLARLSLTNDEILSTQKNLSEIVSYIEMLKEVNVENVEPMFHAVPSELMLREDEILESAGRDALRGSAGYEEGLVKVPKIIE